MGGGALGHAARTQIDAEGDVLPRFQHVLAGPGIRDAAMDRPRHVQRRQNPTLGGVAFPKLQPPEPHLRLSAGRAFAVQRT